MKINTTVLDGATNEPLPFCSVTIKDFDGNQVQGGMADENGVVEFDTAELDKPNRILEVSAVNYDTNSFYSDEWNKPLKIYPKSNSLAEVIVKGIKSKQKEVHKKGYALPVALGVASVACFTMFAIKTWA